MAGLFEGAARLMVATESQQAPVGALAGMRVVDLSSGIAAAYCTKILADLGADVVKVEPATGDTMREQGASGQESLLFWFLQANKRGITLNPATEAGRKTLRSLISRYDVVVESLQPKHRRVDDISYSSVSDDAPALIWLSLTPFGQSGPYADYEGCDLLLQSAAGWLYHDLFSLYDPEPAREPMKTGAQISEYIAGCFGALSVLAAWHHRQATGKGQYIDLSQMEALQTVDAYEALGFSSNGEIRPRLRPPGPGIGIIPCKDGFVGVNILTARQHELFVSFMGKPELLKDPRFATPVEARAHTADWVPIIREWAKDKTMSEIFAAQEWGVPLTVIPTISELLAFPQHQARHFLAERELPDGRKVMQPRLPFIMSESPWALRRTAPMLGEHNQEVLGEELGLGQDEIAALQRGA